LLDFECNLDFGYNLATTNQRQRVPMISRQIFLSTAVLASYSPLHRFRQPNRMRLRSNVALSRRCAMVSSSAPTSIAPRPKASFLSCCSALPITKALAQDFGLRAAALGYIAVIQDVRGRLYLRGEWLHLQERIERWYDTVEWAAALPGSNGKVGMFGGSYVGQRRCWRP